MPSLVKPAIVLPLLLIKTPVMFPLLALVKTSIEPSFVKLSSIMPLFSTYDKVPLFVKVLIVLPLLLVNFPVISPEL